MPKKDIKSKPGLFGMIYYYDENGNPIGKSRPGLIGKTRVYTDQNGRYAGKSRSGFLSKEVYEDSDHHYITSYDTFSGEVHFQNGTPIGRSRPGFFGSSHISLEAEEETCEDISREDEPDTKNEDFAEEPYEESENVDYTEYVPQISSNAVDKERNSLVLFLIICVVIACIYTIIK